MRLSRTRLALCLLLYSCLHYGIEGQRVASTLNLYTGAGQQVRAKICFCGLLEQAWLKPDSGTLFKCSATSRKYESSSSG